MTQTARFPITISQLAELSGVSVHRIRNYLDERLISCCERTPAGHRLFDHDCLSTLSLLQETRNAGLLIQDIKPLLLAMNDNDRQAIHDSVRTLRQQIECRRQSLALLKTKLGPIKKRANSRSHR